MKIKFILFPCLIGLITLASCNSNTKDTTKTTKEDEAPTTSIEVPTTTFIETSTGIETTTVENRIIDLIFFIDYLLLATE